MSYEQNTLDLVPVIFAAGESKMFNMSGNYFELIDCPDPVDVVLSDAVGGQRVRMKQGEASFYSKGVSFSVVQITSATAQTVRFIYGTGEAGTRRSTGSVTVSGAIALDAATLAALEQINVRPEAPSGTYNVIAALAANTAVNVFTAGLNTNGAIILSAMCTEPNLSNNFNVSLLGKASAPANVADGDPVLIACNIWNNGATSGGAASMPTPQFLPAGLGLWWIGAQVTSAASSRAVRFKLL